jgi:zinc protease
MLNEATLDSSAEDLSNQLQKLGSSVSFGAGDKFTTVSIRTLTKNLDATLAIALEKLSRPKFSEQDFMRLQKQQIEGLKHAKKDASVTASNVFQTLLFGADNSFANANSGTITTVSGLTIEDVKAFYQSHFGPQQADLILVSDLPEKAINLALKPLASWQGKHSPMPDIKPFPELKAGTLYFIDKPAAAQSEIRIGKRALTYDATGEYYRASLMNYNLGGAFNSRINLNLREDKGYTYGARSYFSGNEFSGAYIAKAGVRADTTADSIVQFRQEMATFAKEGLTDQELTFVKNAIGQKDARSYETPRQKLGFLSEIMTYDLDPSFVETRNQILDAISKAELDALAAKHVRIDDMITLVVGDKATVLPSLQPMFDKIVELTPEGKPVAN